MGKIVRQRLLVYTMIFVILLVCCFLPGREICEGGETFESGQMELFPGIYQIRLHIGSTDFDKAYIELKSDSAGEKAIMGNTVNLFPGQEYVDFEVYVNRHVTDAYLECGVEGRSGAETFQNFSVWRTRYAARIFLFVFLCAVILLEALSAFRKQINAGSIPSYRWRDLWLLVVGVFLAYLPFCVDYFWMGGDAGFHLLRIEALKESLLNPGGFPIRVHGYWVYEHGSVEPSIYGDLFIFFPAFLRILGFPLMSAFKLFVLSVFVMTAGIAYISLDRCVQDHNVAVVGSLLYLMLPYRLDEVYSRGAMGEFVAMAFLPFLCTGMYLLYTKDPSETSYSRCKWWIVAGMSALLQSHPMTMELASFFMAIVCIAFWRKTFRKETFWQLAQAVMWVGILNAWFLVPMLYFWCADRYHIHAFKQISQENGYTINAMLGSVHHVAFQTCMVALIGGGLFAYMALRDRKYRSKVLIILYAMMLWGLFMVSRWFPWDVVSTFPVISGFANSLEYPFRVMIITSFLTVMFVTFFMSFISHENKKLYKAVLLVVLGATISYTVYYTKWIWEDVDPVYLYTAENKGTSDSWARDYLFIDDDLSDYSYHAPKADQNILWWDYTKKGTNVTIYVENTGDTPGYIELPLTGYRGYAVREMTGHAQEKPAIAGDRGDHGDLKIKVPAGYTGMLKVYYRGFWFFRVAELITLAGIFWIAGNWYQGRRQESGMAMRGGAGF